MALRPWVVGAVVATVLPLYAAPPLTMHVSPRFARAPATVAIYVSFEADVTDYAVEFVLESPAFYRSSRVSLDEHSGPLTKVCEFRNVPSGTYEVRAAVLDGSGRPRAAAREPFVVAP